ncbi:hypothetical protein DM02DRAFT_626635 [Periconia macrospinosa]|uniref:Uncharacterized protein n=1 Tax=Periconia macrospinosa TaxID=97972 RepID=A0A2V1DWW6_9PLEO|nr:hypothetical protein DM02DRAFT_626635 [Periconia macrospinosa]
MLLKFSMHRDFLLTADRQSMNMSSTWNQSLRDALPDAFVKFVKQLIDERRDMKYSWPCFIPSPEVHAFFKSESDSILERLKELQLLESLASSLVKPSNLLYVDLAKYSDAEGQPFTLHHRND